VSMQRCHESMAPMAVMAVMVNRRATGNSPDIKHRDGLNAEKRGVAKGSESREPIRSW